jgi:hypothetical protein
LPEEERAVVRAFRISPEVAADLESLIPKGERSSFVEEVLKRALQRKRRAAEGEA